MPRAVGAGVPGTPRSFFRSWWGVRVFPVRVPYRKGNTGTPGNTSAAGVPGTPGEHRETPHGASSGEVRDVVVQLTSVLAEFDSEPSEGDGAVDPGELGFPARFDVHGFE